MKQIVFIFLSIISVININAQNLFSVDLKNSTFSWLYFTENVDSISHTSPNKTQIYTHNEVYEFDQSDVNKITFNVSNHGYYEIPTSLIEGWDEGYYFSSGCYAVIKEDHETDGFLLYINRLYSDNNGILVYYDKNQNIKSIVSDNKAIFVKTDDTGNKLMYCVNGSTYEIEDYDEMQASQQSYTRAANNWTNPLVLINDLITGKGRYDSLNSFFSGNWEGTLNGIGTDLGATALGTLIGGPFLGILIGGSFQILDWKKKELDNIGISLLLGEMHADITEINRTGYKKIQVNVEINQSATRPYGKTRNKQVDVKVGCYFRKNYYDVSYKYHDGETEFVEVDSDGQLSFEIDDLSIGEAYYVIPAVIPSFRYYCDNNNTRYGTSEPVYLEKPSASITEITNITESSCSIICEFSNIWPEIDCYCDIEGGGHWHSKLDMSGNGTHTFVFEDLRPNTSYKAVAYPKYEGKEEYSPNKYFSTLPPNIDGTWQCVESDGTSYTVTIQNGECSWSKEMDSPGSVSWLSDGNLEFSILEDWYYEGWGRYSSVNFTGSVDNLYNPSIISGNVEYHSGMMYLGTDYLTKSVSFTMTR